MLPSFRSDLLPRVAMICVLGLKEPFQKPCFRDHMLLLKDVILSTQMLKYDKSTV